MGLLWLCRLLHGIEPSNLFCHGDYECWWTGCCYEWQSMPGCPTGICCRRQRQSKGHAIRKHYFIYTAIRHLHRGISWDKKLSKVDTNTILKWRQQVFQYLFWITGYFLKFYLFSVLLTLRLYNRLFKQDISTIVYLSWIWHGNISDIYLKTAIVCLYHACYLISNIIMSTDQREN